MTFHTDHKWWQETAWSVQRRWLWRSCSRWRGVCVVRKQTRVQRKGFSTCSEGWQRLRLLTQARVCVQHALWRTMTWQKKKNLDQPVPSGEKRRASGAGKVESYSTHEVTLCGHGEKEMHINPSQWHFCDELRGMRERFGIPNFSKSFDSSPWFWDLNLSW